MEYLNIGDPMIPSFQPPATPNLSGSNNSIWWILGGIMVITIIGYVAYQYGMKYEIRKLTKKEND
jgi:drug/metabolite transporter (DMT)-like permease